MDTNRYRAPAPNVQPGWRLSSVRDPSKLFGANGMRIGPDGELYVAQAFGSQVSALDLDSGAARTVVAVGSDVVAPDDLAFDSHGVLYMTEVMNGRVSAQSPNGEVRVIADNVPVANGITIHDDRIFMDEFRVGGRILELFADGSPPRVIADDLIMPNALAMGPDGALYFPQVSQGEIWRVATNGGSPERVIAGLALPTAVKFNPQGELFTVEGGSGDISQIDLQARTRKVVATVRPGIDNFTFTPDGRLFVSHFVDGGVAEIGPNGEERILASAGLLGPFGLAAADDGTLYIADGMSLAIIGSDGSLAARPALLVNHDFPGFVRGVAIAPGGGCYLTTTAGTIARYRAGKEIQVIGSDLGNISGITVAPNGNLIACVTDNGEVLQVTPAGKVSTLARGLKTPLGVAAAADGSCFVAQAAGGNVVHLGGGDPTVVIKGLSEPHGVAVSGDSLFVLDRATKSLVYYDHETGQSITVATDLPIGSEPGLTPKILPGIAGLLPGPLLPFADLAATRDGRILISADGAGAVISISRC